MKPGGWSGLFIQEGDACLAKSGVLLRTGRLVISRAMIIAFSKQKYQ